MIVRKKILPQSDKKEYVIDHDAQRKCFEKNRVVRDIEKTKNRRTNSITTEPVEVASIRVKNRYVDHLAVAAHKRLPSGELKKKPARQHTVWEKQQQRRRQQHDTDFVSRRNGIINIHQTTSSQGDDKLRQIQNALNIAQCSRNLQISSKLDCTEAIREANTRAALFTKEIKERSSVK
ncbi:hypothetical protein CBL_10458 [Carabus blaptoides fortunei]